MQIWIERARHIATFSEGWREKARRRLDGQTRPKGSLGLLEDVITRIVAIQQTTLPDLSRKRILIFAADHGVEEEGVSLYPREVTQAMVFNFLNGGATINALARQIGAEVSVVDMGVDGDFKGDHRLVHAKIRRGSRNMMREEAMTAGELDRALQTGWDLVHQAKADGIHLLGLGEMGIGNTTSASAVIAALTGTTPDLVTGRGTGLDVKMRKKKVNVIECALALHHPSMKDPLFALRSVGGYEIAALTGAILAAAKLGLPVVIDGWIVSAAALVALRLNPRILDFLFFAHESGEQGHSFLLQELEVRPLLHLGMRLGEASGAALAMGILDSMCRIYREVATFEEAAVAHARQDHAPVRHDR